MADARDLYIDLMKRSLKNIPYIDAEMNPIIARGWFRRTLFEGLERFGVRLAHAYRPNLPDRMSGTDHTSTAHTMVSMARLDNVQACVEAALRDGVPGDLIETGVLRGGTSIFMRGLLEVHGDTSRTVWVADSFEGLPRPNEEKYPADEGSKWHKFTGGDVGLDAVRGRFDRYGLLDDRVQFLPGWFRDTLASAPIEQLALLRLDGDMYESTMDALVPLYPKLAVGGFVIVDDWELPPCRQAVEDFRSAQGITDPLVEIDGAAMYWRRTA